jgi:hypothetical protein
VRPGRAPRVGDPLPTTAAACDAELELLDLNLVPIQREGSPEIAARIEAAQPGWTVRATAAAASITARRTAVVERRTLLDRVAARELHAALEQAAAERRAARAAAAAAERGTFHAAFVNQARLVLPPPQFTAVLAAVDHVAPGTLPKWAQKIVAARGGDAEGENTATARGRRGDDRRREKPAHAAAPHPNYRLTKGRALTSGA